MELRRKQQNQVKLRKCARKKKTKKSKRNKYQTKQSKKKNNQSSQPQTKKKNKHKTIDKTTDKTTDKTVMFREQILQEERDKLNKSNIQSRKSSTLDILKLYDVAISELLTGTSAEYFFHKAPDGILKLLMGGTQKTFVDGDFVIYNNLTSQFYKMDQCMLLADFISFFGKTYKQKIENNEQLVWSVESFYRKTDMTVLSADESCCYVLLSDPHTAWKLAKDQNNKYRLMPQYRYRNNDGNICYSDPKSIKYHNSEVIKVKICAGKNKLKFIATHFC